MHVMDLADVGVDVDVPRRCVLLHVMLNVDLVFHVWRECEASKLLLVNVDIGNE